MHPFFDFTMETINKQLPFADVLINFNDGVISTDIYY